MTYVSAAKAYIYHPRNSLELVAIKGGKIKKLASHRFTLKREAVAVGLYSRLVSSPGYRSGVGTVLLLRGDMVSVSLSIRASSEASWEIEVDSSSSASWADVWDCSEGKRKSGGG